MSVSVIERVFLPALEMRLVHLPYKSPSDHWSNGTYEFIMKGETLMSFPWDFMGDDVPVERRVSWFGRVTPQLYVLKSGGHMGTKRSRWGRGNNVFEHLVNAYRDCPRDQLLEPLEANYDPWGIVDIMRAADRRLSFTRLTMHAIMMEDGREAARRVLAERFKDRKSRYK
jgi:hypothetical protein